MTINILTLDQKMQMNGDSAEEFFVNMGPQHPSTHGVLRLVLKLDGETIKEVIPVLGYIHRGIEKIAEHSTFRQFVHLSDRMDYLSALMNNWAVSRAIETAMEIESNPRIETIRTILAELQRIQSHQLWWGVFAMDLGAITPFLYGFRDREILTEILEENCGARLTMNYIQPAGVLYDIHPNFCKKVKSYLEYVKPKIEEYENLVGGNVIIRNRTKGIGVLSGDDALALGATGPVLRASGVPYDLRKVKPYGVYDKVDFSVAVGTRGDSWDRYAVRIEEMRQSVKIVEQLIDGIPEGPHMTKKPGAKLKVPKGVYYSEMETARGIIGILMSSEGGEVPHRMHVRSPNFNNLWSITKIAPGYKIADLVTMLSTLDVVIPDIDR